MGGPQEFHLKAADSPDTLSLCFLIEKHKSIGYIGHNVDWDCIEENPAHGHLVTGSTSPLPSASMDSTLYLLNREKKD